MTLKPPADLKHADPILAQVHAAIVANNRPVSAIARKAGIDEACLRNFKAGRTKTMPLLSVAYLIPVVMPGQVLAIVPRPAKD